MEITIVTVALAGAVIVLLVLAVLFGARAQSRGEDLDSARGEINELRAQKENDARRIASLESETANAKAAVKERDEFVESAKEIMSDRFKTLAQEVLNEKEKSFDEKSKGVLSPLHKELKEFRERVESIHSSDKEQRAELRGELTSHIDALKKNAAQLSTDATELSRALKGDSKMRGDWGELTLERLLQNSGLREGEEYEMQKALQDDDGRHKQPDAVVYLPENRHLIVDSKLSLNDYAEFANAEDGDARQGALKNHLQSVRRHIKDLSGKHYGDAKGVNAPDFVFLFMPIEPAFFAALEGDRELFQYAYEKKIILTAPTTLLAVMKTVEHVWRMERQNQNALAIAKQGGNLYDKFAGFVDDMKKTGDALERAAKAHGGAMNKLIDGQGNLVRQAEKLRELGVKSQKNLPPEIAARAGDDD